MVTAVGGWVVLELDRGDRGRRLGGFGFQRVDRRRHGGGLGVRLSRPPSAVGWFWVSDTPTAVGGRFEGGDDPLDRRRRSANSTAVDLSLSVVCGARMLSLWGFSRIGGIIGVSGCRLLLRVVADLGVVARPGTGGSRRCETCAPGHHARREAAGSRLVCRGGPTRWWRRAGVGGGGELGLHEPRPRL